MDNSKQNLGLFNNPKGWFHQLFINEAILGLLLVFCFIGIAYTDISGVQSLRYWLWMVPGFALAAIIMEWSHSVRKDRQDYHFIWQQALHWFAVYIALKVVFVLLHLGRLPNDGASFVLMTIMSLATFLAGVYINWRFLLLGIFIALATIFAAYLEAYVWVLIPIALAIIGIGFLIGRREFRALKQQKFRRGLYYV